MSPVHMEKFESAVRLAAGYNDAFNKMDLQLIGRLLDDNCIFEDPGPAPEGSVFRGKRAVLDYLKDYFDRHPEIKRETEELTGFGKRCLLRWKCSWKNENGILQYLRGIDVFIVKNESITEKFTYIKG